VTLVYDSIEQAILVPEQAIMPIGTDKFVFRVVDDKAVLTKVTLGQRFRGRVQVSEGLAAGDSVVTAGQLKIQDGAPVAVVPSNGAAVSAAEPAES
jgi:membrane fusion protein (multidrug efflux system)